MIVRAAGATAAAVGATGIVWLFSSTATGAADREPLTYAALVAIVGWLVLRGRAPRPSAFIAARDALRTTCGAAIPLFLVANLLAAYHDTKLAAWGAAMRADLRNLWTLQQNVLADSGRYLDAVSPDEYSESYGVIGPSIALTTDGWTASVQHETSPQTCAIFAGSAPLAPAVTAGTPACTRVPLDKKGLAFNLALVVGGLLMATLAVQRRARLNSDLLGKALLLGCALIAGCKNDPGSPGTPFTPGDPVLLSTGSPTKDEDPSVLLTPRLFERGNALR